MHDNDRVRGVTVRVLVRSCRKLAAGSLAGDDREYLLARSLVQATLRHWFPLWPLYRLPCGSHNASFDEVRDAWANHILESDRG